MFAAILGISEFVEGEGLDVELNVSENLSVLIWLPKMCHSRTLQISIYVGSFTLLEDKQQRSRSSSPSVFGWQAFTLTPLQAQVLRFSPTSVVLRRCLS